MANPAYLGADNKPRDRYEGLVVVSNHSLHTLPWGIAILRFVCVCVCEIQL